MYAATTMGFGEDAVAVSSSRRAVSVISMIINVQAALEGRFLEKIEL